MKDFVLGTKLKVMTLVSAATYEILLSVVWWNWLTFVIILTRALFCNCYCYLLSKEYLSFCRVEGSGEERASV